MVRALVANLGENVANAISSYTYLPKIAAPFTTVVNRALVTNFAADGLPKFGIDRKISQQVVEVPGESGPNGEKIWKPLNDFDDAIRLIGGWSNTVGTSGQYSGSSGAPTNADSMEITFYGTALNLGLITGNAGVRTVAVSVDGGAPVSVQWDFPTSSNIIFTRGYSPLNFVNIVNGLSQGLHTVRIAQNNNSNFFLYGYEVVNSAPTIFLPPSLSFSGSRRLLSQSAGSTSYNSAFESGTLGTRGGHVLVYQKADGTIAKSVTPTNSASAALASADHTNEEISRIYHWREFGAGRADDFSQHIPSLADKAFTLDDGTTTLIGSQCHADGVDAICPAAASSYVAITFVGTGLDIVKKDDSTSIDPHAVTVDATSIGNLPTNGIAGTFRTVKIVSGLPYGTHTVRVSRTTVITGATRLSQFIVYGPKTPTLPSGAVALSDYFIMADYVADATYGGFKVSTGVLRKMLTREAIYSGTWNNAPGVDPGFGSGINLRTQTAASSVELLFFGIGINFRMYLGSATYNLTFAIDGAAPGAGSSWSSPATGMTYVPGTGVLSGTAAGGVGYGGSLFQVTGLTLGVHRLKVTFNSGTDWLYADDFDVITPIHAPKEIGPARLQNAALIGSSAIRDLRNFSPIQIPPAKNWSQAIGVGTGQTTTSTTGIPCADLSVTVKAATAGSYQITAAYLGRNDAINNAMGLYLFVNGVQAPGPYMYNRVFAVNLDIEVMIQTTIRLEPGTHKIDAYWGVGAGTGTVGSINRFLTVCEL